jgi:hypothetical protein
VNDLMEISKFPSFDNPQIYEKVVSKAATAQGKEVGNVSDLEPIFLDGVSDIVFDLVLKWIWHTYVNFLLR